LLPFNPNNDDNHDDDVKEVESFNNAAATAELELDELDDDVGC
jgi:hypothetical protein